MTSSEWRFMSALEMRERIRTRQVPSAELTADVLARIDASQPTLNAFITVDLRMRWRRRARPTLPLRAETRLEPCTAFPYR